MNKVSTSTARLLYRYLISCFCINKKKTISKCCCSPFIGGARAPVSPGSATEYGVLNLNHYMIFNLYIKEEFFYQISNQQSINYKFLKC